jgi:hypothetical protein
MAPQRRQLFARAALDLDHWRAGEFA